MERQEIKYDYDTLVISGGAIKGLILLGAAQSCIDNLLLKNVVNYIGSSAGAMIAYLLAIGYTPVEIVVYICTNRLVEYMQSFNLVAMINSEGAVTYNHIQHALEKMTLHKVGKYLTMRELHEMFGKKFICSTYNRTRQKTEYIGPDNYPDLPCLIAIRMSSNLPFLFDKFKYMGHEYYDGGISDNFPVVEAEKIGQKILGLYLMPGDNSNSPGEDSDNGFIADLFHMLFVPVMQTTLYRISQTTDKTTCIRLDQGNLRFFDFNLRSGVKLDMFSSGYQQVKKFLSAKAKI